MRLKTAATLAAGWFARHREVAARLLLPSALGAESPQRRYAEFALRHLHLQTGVDVIAVATAVMERAIRVVSVERAHDPRAFALLAFGGAGGLHAAELAAALGMTRVYVPPQPGLLSAWGVLAADVVRDYGRTFRVVEPDERALAVGIRSLAAVARREIGRTARIEPSRNSAIAWTTPSGWIRTWICEYSSPNR